MGRERSYRLSGSCSVEFVDKLFVECGFRMLYIRAAASHGTSSGMTNKRVKRNVAPAAVAKAGTALTLAIANKSIAALRIPGSQNRYAVPSTSIPHHKYMVHLTPTDSRNSCDCPAHKFQRIRPCKHVVALKKLLMQP